MWRIISSLNSNALLCIIITGLNSLANGIWGNIALTAYLFLLTGSTEMVGYLEGVMGMLNLGMSGPAGWLADKYPRQTILRFSSFIGTLAIGLGYVAFLLPGLSKLHRYWMLFGTMATIGVAKGLKFAGQEAIFGDSVPTNQRSEIYTFRSTISSICVGVGLLLPIIVFELLGNKWTLEPLTIVCLVGLGIKIFPETIKCFLRDSRSLGDESEGLLAKKKDNAEPCDDDADESRALEDPTDNETTSIEEATKQDKDDKDKPDGVIDEVPLVVDTEPTEPTSFFGLTKQSVPWILTLSDMMKALGGGLVEKFFPIFFVKHVHITPTAVSVLFSAGLLLLSASVILAMKASFIIGRVQVTVLCRSLGCAITLAMGLFPSIWSINYAIVPLYLLRQVLMFSDMALRKTVVSDFVPKKDRAKWNSMMSMQKIGWSGSAILGGFLIKHYGFSTTFYVTAALQFIGGTLPNILIADLVPMNKARADK